MSNMPPRSAASHAALPPEGDTASLGRPGAGELPPRSQAPHGALSSEGGQPTWGGPALAGPILRML